jgi:hypothetical protein
MLVFASCSAIPSASAEEACRSIFSGWQDAADRCAFEPSMPDPEVCELSYSYDADMLEDDCLPWMKTAPCEELGNPQFQAHCGKVMYFRTW